MYELVVQHAIKEIRRLQGNVASAPGEKAYHKSKRWISSGKRKYTDDELKSFDIEADRSREDIEQWEELIGLIERENRRAGL